MSNCKHSQDGEYIACIYCDIDHATNEGYKEGIAWERKRWEMLSQIEQECKCNNKIFHLQSRAYRSEDGIDYDLEFGDVG